MSTKAGSKMYLAILRHFNAHTRMLCRHSSSHSNSMTGVNNLKSHSFPAIKSIFDYNSDHARKNKEMNMHIFQETKNTHQDIIKKGSSLPKMPPGMNKLSVYDRISLLKDPGTQPLYLSITAGLNLPYGNVNNGGVVSTVTQIMGEQCVIIASNWIFKGGTAYPITVKKQLRAQEIALMNRLPSVHLVDSGGAFLPLQADIFPDKEHGGRTFRNQAVMSSLGLPQIAVVCGPCTAGGAYIPTMSDEAVIIKGTGSLYLAGPPLVKAATGETIGAEELGGADVHCRISGCTDHYATNEEEAMETTRHIVSTLNMKKNQTVNRISSKLPLYNCSIEDMASLVPINTEQQRWPIMEILARICDGSGFHSFKDKFGENLICGYARIDGYLVGILANNGELDAPAAVKGAHFIRLCDIRGIPMIFLQHTVSDSEFLSLTGNVGTTAKARGQMMSMLSCSQVPKLTVLMGGSYGPSSYAMCGRAMNPNFLFSWPCAKVGVASSEHITKAITEMNNGTDNIEIIHKRVTEEEKSFSSYLIDDGVILPHETRQVLSQCLEICLTYQDMSHHSRDTAVIRM